MFKYILWCCEVCMMTLMVGRDVMWRLLMLLSFRLWQGFCYVNFIHVSPGNTISFYFQAHTNMIMYVLHTIGIRITTQVHWHLNFLMMMMMTMTINQLTIKKIRNNISFEHSIKIRIYKIISYFYCKCKCIISSLHGNRSYKT